MNEIIEMMRPPTWDEYIGQRSIKERLEVIIDAAMVDARPLDPILLTGPPGAGKTSFASLIAQRAGEDFLDLTVPMSMTQNNLIRFFIAIEDFQVGFILLDEIHNAPAQLQEILQMALLEKVIKTPDHYLIDVSQITFIAATTTENRNQLLDPLVQRFTLHFTWDAYTDDDMALIFQGMARRLGVSISDNVVKELARASGGTPRYVERLVKRARDLQATGRDITAEAVLELAGLDRDGLTSEHLIYLRTLHAWDGGTTGMQNLKNMLRMSAASIEELERLLIHRGYIRLTPRGRQLTSSGRAKASKPHSYATA